jgi:uncharacterized membrane protein YfcA
MPDISPFVAMFVFAVFVLAGLVKGVTGMGLPTVAMGLLALIMPAAAAASLLLLPSLLTNVWQGVAGPGLRPTLRRLWSMMLGAAAGTVAAAPLLAAAGPGSKIALGVMLMVYGVVGLSGLRLRVSRAAEPWASPAVGLVTGMVTGATGVFVMPSVPYLQALGLEKDDLVQALGLSFTVSTLALGGGLAVAGGLDSGALAASGLALVPAGLGMALGQALRRRIPAEPFRRVFFASLLLVGAGLALTG